MPKKRKSKPARAKNQLVQDTATAPSRHRRLRIVAIWIILSLILSLLVGALSITPTPAGAAEVVQSGVSETQLVDTDGDGLENNLDPDVDGDGLSNGEDDDIDGDGIANFDDADPVDTTDIDSNAPQKPLRPVHGFTEYLAKTAWVWISISVGMASVFAAWMTARKRRKNR